MPKTAKPKCIEVHQGLSDKEIRDYLATEATLCYDQEAYVDPEVARLQFEEAKKRLEASKKLQALKSLMAQRGWKHFDVSDEVTDFDGRSANGSRRYMGFVGTEKEHRETFASLKELSGGEN
jgi:hypothetical protein